MAIGKKLRFEVFKRDNFKCQYCGATAPEVILHVDHIKPKKGGGEDVITNLITSCSDCNLGKGARLLSDKSVLEKQRKQLEELNQRREQLEMMMKWREGLVDIEDQKLHYAISKFEELACCKITDSGEKKIKKLLKEFPLNLVLESIEASTLQYLEQRKNEEGYTDESRAKAFDYIGRICTCKSKSEEKPYMKDLFYIRGILKNRLSYIIPHKAITWLEELHLAGYSVQTLKNFALDVRNWSQFEKAVEEALNDADGENDAQ